MKRELIAMVAKNDEFHDFLSRPPPLTSEEAEAAEAEFLDAVDAVTRQAILESLTKSGAELGAVRNVSPKMAQSVAASVFLAEDYADRLSDFAEMIRHGATRLRSAVLGRADGQSLWQLQRPASVMPLIESALKDDFRWGYRSCLFETYPLSAKSRVLTKKSADASYTKARALE
jgi:hypothetical protein